MYMCMKNALLMKHGIMKLGSKYDLLDPPTNLKCKQIYWSKYLQSVEKIQWKL